MTIKRKICLLVPSLNKKIKSENIIFSFIFRLLSLFIVIENLLESFSLIDKVSPSGISVLNENKEYLEFEKNKWIKKKDTKNINHYEANFLKIIKLFLNSKYLWGDKTLNGIDCSALIQIYFYYNRIFFPRESKDQIKYCKKKKNKKFNKGDIIFWKGHVGICLNKSKFIHAYGPRKKVLIMPINTTIELIKKTANLKVKKVTNINKY